MQSMFSFFFLKCKFSYGLFPILPRFFPIHPFLAGSCRLAGKEGPSWFVSDWRGSQPARGTCPTLAHLHLKTILRWCCYLLKCSIGILRREKKADFEEFNDLHEVSQWSGSCSHDIESRQSVWNGDGWGAADCWLEDENLESAVCVSLWGDVLRGWPVLVSIVLANHS